MKVKKQKFHKTKNQKPKTKNQKPKTKIQKCLNDSTIHQNLPKSGHTRHSRKIMSFSKKSKNESQKTKIS
jgi:hypothetical protein